MRIALINENSQADKNLLIYEKLCKSAEKNGHEVLSLVSILNRKKEMFHIQS